MEAQGGPERPKESQEKAFQKGGERPGALGPSLWDHVSMGPGYMAKCSARGVCVYLLVTLGRASEQ